MMNAIPQFVPQDVCLACDGCCRFAEPESVWRPKVFDGEEAEDACTALDAHRCVQARVTGGQCECVFFERKTNTCQIYDQRPWECRLYPFMLTRRGEHVWVVMHLACPHIQDALGSESLKNFVITLQSYFEQDDVVEFLRRHAQNVTDYTAYTQELEDLFVVRL